ncbi:hypothetical protein CPHO_03705 [Corynebacterium phocae]|uniref:Antitoxin SocA-like Panacea domain-containing protein n=1 Tax=Corynebacterium phocae TaxID=161895 RepID=A0A1L7D226_9CORY|nr:Panacea domain-containing protein [Corynebacterium phocae]APT92140.1 hypothetical protein CPHO_03705 [Corynebacterium phocae]KAA8725924.1 DUF4065 domain-containing protein [Corynebacterium phocae]
MATAAAVSNYILGKLAPGRSLDVVKLQKLLYFCQGWSLAIYGKPLFPEDFEAWRRGPVVKEIYKQHRQMYQVPQGFLFGNASCAEDLEGETTSLTEEERKVVELVVNDYGSLNTFALVDLSHIEGGPWSAVHRADGTPAQISKEAIKAYFDKELARVRRTGQLLP